MPSSKGLDGIDMLVDQEVGFLAAGDVMTTLPVRETLRAVMARLWVNPSLITELSMRRVSDVSAQILHRLWRVRSEMDPQQVFAAVCLVGYCPQQKSGRAFLLEPRIVGNSTEVVTQELSGSDGPVYFGSGAKIARQLSAEQPELTPPQVVRKIVSEKLDQTVGGHVQYGKLIGKDFEVFAVYDFALDEQQRALVGGYHIAGMELLAEAEQLRLPEGYMLLPGKAVAPFDAEQSHAINQGFHPVTNYSHIQTLIGKPFGNSTSP